MKNRFWWQEANSQLIPSWSISQRRPAEPFRFSVRLPSQDEGLWFDAEFELVVETNIRDRRQHQRAIGGVRLEVLSLAREETQRHTVADVGLAEAELSQRLLSRDVFNAPEIHTGAVSVSLSASADDIDLVKRRERCSPQYAIEAEEHRARMLRLQRLADDVFSDPSVARRWWYDQNSDRIHELGKAADALELMATHRCSPTDSPAQSDTAGSLVDAFLRELPEADQDAVHERMALLLDSFGRSDLSERLRKQRTEEEFGDG